MIKCLNSINHFVDSQTNHTFDMAKYSMTRHGIFYHVTYSPIHLFTHSLISIIAWFKILSQYGAGIILFLGLVSIMKYPPNFKWMKISQDDASITFKHHNFVQEDLLTSMWRTLQYLHLLESICLASYNEHGINISNVLFHGLQYYRKMMQVLLAF